MGIFSSFRLPSVKADEAVTAGRDAVLLDVREKAEWNAGHAPGATHIPLGRITDAPKRLPKNKRIIVMCRSGNRSRGATNALRQAGLDAVNLSGGMRAWVRAGGSVIDRNNRPGQVV